MVYHVPMSGDTKYNHSVDKNIALLLATYF